MKAWRTLPLRFARALLPARCLLCAEPGEDERELCAPCRAALPWAPAGGGAAFLYAAPVDHLLRRFKFHGDLAAGALLAALMAQAFAGAEHPQALVPLPLHRSRLRQRGYDQALELAKPLALALRVPLQAGLLQRARATAPQSELGALQRQANVRGAFTAGATALRHVALLDDVMTTGATAQAAAQALHAAGVARVDRWVCARVP